MERQWGELEVAEHFMMTVYYNFICRRHVGCNIILAAWMEVEVVE